MNPTRTCTTPDGERFDVPAVAAIPAAIDGTDPDGAIDLDACPNPRRYRGRRTDCRCTPCAVCGFGPHTAIHGPAFGMPPGSKPVGHRYVPRPEAGHLCDSCGGKGFTPTAAPCEACAGYGLAQGGIGPDDGSTDSPPPAAWPREPELGEPIG